MTLVLIEKGIVLEGWPSKIDVIGALGIHNNHIKFHNNRHLEAGIP